MKIRMKFFLLLLTTFLVSYVPPLHQDTPLKVDKNHNIIGLPKEFSPAKFDLDKKYLRIEDHEIIFPKCINYYFDILENPTVALSASWYHSKEFLPYYLNINISSKKVNCEYSVLVDLETLELIEVEETIRKKNYFTSTEVELGDFCLSSYFLRLKHTE